MLREIITQANTDINLEQNERGRHTHAYTPTHTHKHTHKHIHTHTLTQSGRLSGHVGPPRAPGRPQMDAPRPAVRFSAVLVEIRALGSHFVAIFAL